jgi:hypothetical protein
MESSVRTFTGEQTARLLNQGIPVTGPNRIAADVFRSLLQSDPGITWPKMLGTYCELVGKHTADKSDHQVVRAGLSMASVQDAFTGLVNMHFFAGYESVPNSTDGWVTPASLQSFLPAHAVGVFEECRLSRAGRQEADSGYFGMFAENWALARYASQLNIDEQDLVNSPSVDLSMAAARALGRAAACCVGDIIFGLLMRNEPTTRDGLRFFCTDHGNYATGGSSALDETPLDTALAAVASQSSPDEETSIPIPTFTRGKYLIVSPALLGKARRLCRWMSLADGNDLIVRPEPRLTLGVADPSTETIISGSTTSWMLASPSSIGPSVVVGGLDGAPRPQLRQYKLGGPGGFSGQWGVGFDIVLDIGAVALDPRGLYWSDGA